MTSCLLRHDRAEVWCADSLDPEAVAGIMGGRLADALIVDAPYSDKTHSGHDGAAAKATEKSRSWLRANGRVERKIARAEIDYPCWTATDVGVACSLWVPHTRGWVISITDDVLAPAWAAGFVAGGLYAFAPLPLVETGSRVRLSGDGPSGWTCWIVVARPRTAPWSKWGTLPGAYVQPAESKINSDRITGGKPLASMVEIVADYTRQESPLCLAPGSVPSVVLDPTAGAGTTLLAALRLGRRVIGIEKDPGRAQLCAERVAAELENSERWARQVGQGALFGGRNG